MIVWVGGLKKQARWRVSLDNEATVVPLFGIPVFNTNIGEATQEEIDYVKSVEYERMNVKNGWYSSDKYVLDKPELAPLKNRIMAGLELFVRGVLHVRQGIDFYMLNSWSVKHDKEDWGQSHVHTNCLLSGVYYLQTDEKSGQIRFRRDTNWTNLFPISADLEYDDFNTFNSRVWSFQPQNGMLFFFPSHLLHSIDDNESDNQRYSLAFNFYARGKLGTKEFELELK